MKIDGQQLISRATYTSNRSLIAACSVVLLSHYNDIKLENLVILGIQPGMETFQITLKILIPFLVFNHFISWWGDFNSFQKWNAGKNVSATLFDAYGGEFPTQFEDTINTLKACLAKSESDISPENETLLKSLHTDLTELKESAKNLGYHARIYLYGWFLIMPLLLGAWSFCVLIVISAVT